MILFKKHFIFPILTGLKTQTRRTWKRPQAKAGAIHKAKTDYSPCYFAELHILKVSQERLGDITEQDAQKEGGYNLESYKAEFKRVYGFWDADLEVYVVDFETV